MKKLRPDQSAAIDNLRNAMRETKRVVVSAPTGFGKTVVLADIVSKARDKDKKVLITVPMISLVDQTVIALNAQGVDEIGVIQADHHMTDWSRPIQVCSVQTLQHRWRDREMPKADLVLADECFAAGTNIATPFGNKTIENVRVGDCIYNAMGVGFVTGTIAQRKHIILVRLSNGTTIRVTENHPFFTEQGWQTAGDLAVGSQVFSQEAVRELREAYEASGDREREAVVGETVLLAKMRAAVALERPHSMEGSCEECDGDMRALWATFPAMERKAWKTSSRSGFQGAKILYGLLCEEGGESYVDSWREGAGAERDFEGWVQARPAWRRWERPVFAEAATGAFAGVGSRLDIRAGGSYETRSQQWILSELLQDRHSEYATNDWDRSRWGEPQCKKKEGTGCEERQFAGKLRVESISREEQGCAEIVYNLRVSGHPSYFAEGVLVHNCHRMFSMFSEWMLDPDWMKIPFVGFSATPWSKGLGKLYDRLVVASDIRKLIDDGVLVPFRTFAPDTPDLTGVRTLGGEFVAADLDEVMRPKKLVANIVATWKELANGRTTVAFCCSRAHADQLAKEFTDAGIGAGYMDCETPLLERAEVRRRMLAGDVQVVCNVDVIGLGVDYPEIGCIIIARPTMSDIRHVQQIGRGLRMHSSKTDGLIILDHSTTTQRLGFVDEIYGYHQTLDDGKTKPKAEVVLLPKECPACHLLKAPRAAICPHCGFKAEYHADPVPVERGTLREVRPTDEMADWRKQLPDKAHCFGQLWWYGQKKGYKQGWAAVKTKEIFGSFPKARVPDPEMITEPVIELVNYLWISKEKWKKEQNNARWLAQRANGNGHMNGNGHDKGALSDREQAIIDRVADQAKSSLMTDQDWSDMGDFR